MLLAQMRSMSVVAKTPKLTYAEAVRVSRTLHSQNISIDKEQAPNGERLEQCKTHAH